MGIKIHDIVRYKDKSGAKLGDKVRVEIDRIGAIEGEMRPERARETVQ
jgi:hypothetical protein